MLEEASNHPITHKEGRPLISQHDFARNSLSAWLTFLESVNGTVVLDGYALQSTVRFLYANGVSRQRVEDYFNRWQELTHEATLVYFPVENPRQHFDVVFAERGDEWISKLYSYVEHTPLGVANSLHSTSGFLEFWSDYQQLCHELLDAAHVPVHFIDSRSWNDGDLELLATQVGLLPEWL